MGEGAARNPGNSCALSTRRPLGVGDNEGKGLRPPSTASRASPETKEFTLRHNRRMPKTYAMGGRVSAAAPGGGPPLPQAQRWRERLGALRNLPPFLKLVWQTSPALTLGSGVLRFVRALLPSRARIHSLLYGLGM